MNKNEFTLSLALVDTLPVLFFGLAAGMLGWKLRSAVFFLGAVICLLAGAGKVLWKLLIALRSRDVKLLGAQLRYLMPLGFALMIAGAVLADRATLRGLLRQAVRMPSVLCFALGALGLIAMILCAKKYDRRDMRGNWIEQGINAAAQGFVLLGVLLL